MLKGELVDWNDARGFGFIAAEDGTRYFVHISTIGRIATRPRTGDRVSFLPAKGKDGRPQARLVTIAGANPRATRDILQRGQPAQPMRLDWRLPLAFALLAVMLTGVFEGRLPWLVGVTYLTMGLVSFFQYAADKQSAEIGAWRTSEVRLLSADLLFGIIGGLLAQAIFRHKTRKEGFVFATLLLALVHLLWLGGFALGLIDPTELAALFGP
jgi:uncharacterized membrane protein YsdA (DUF1294 family)/cold shock CspA family protein